MILVTGGTGLLGSHLLLELSKNNDNINVLVRDKSATAHIEKFFLIHNMQDVYSRIKWIEGDLLDFSALSNACKDIKQIYHCAAIVSFNEKNKNEMYKANVNGTANIVNLALENKIEKLCHVSSIATLGRAENDGIVDEETHWKKSKLNSQYSISKYYAENEVWRGIAEGLNAVIVNPSIILGPDVKANGSNPLISLMTKGTSFYPSGTNGFIDVRDVVKVMILLMNSEINNERYILSSETMSYKDLFEVIASVFNTKRPTVSINKTLAKSFFQFESILKVLTGRKPILSNDLINTSYKKYNYSNSKILQAIDFKFTPIKDSIEYIKQISDTIL